MPTNEHGVLTSDIRPTTVSLIWKAERSDLPLTVDAALARAKRRLLDQGATVTAVDPTTLTFQWPRGGRGVSWSNVLVGCKVSATSSGSTVGVTVEASFAVFAVLGIAFIALLAESHLWWFGDLTALMFVGTGVYASSRLKDIARFAMCMIPDEDGAI